MYENRDILGQLEMGYFERKASRTIMGRSVAKLMSLKNDSCCESESRFTAPQELRWRHEKVFCRRRIT